MRGVTVATRMGLIRHFDALSESAKTVSTTNLPRSDPTGLPWPRLQLNDMSLNQCLSSANVTAVIGDSDAGVPGVFAFAALG
jgi:hypothetical protein